MLTAKNARTEPRIDAWHTLCGRHDVPLLAAAVQFPLTHPAVDSVLVGACGPQEIADSMTWLSNPVPPALWNDAKRSGLIPEDAPIRT